MVNTGTLCKTFIRQFDPGPREHTSAPRPVPFNGNARPSLPTLPSLSKELAEIASVVCLKPNDLPAINIKDEVVIDVRPWLDIPQYDDLSLVDCMLNCKTGVHSLCNEYVRRQCF